MGRFRNALRSAEQGIARSVLRWKFQKEGKPPLPEEELERVSAKTVEEANRILGTRSRNVLNELKKAVREFTKPGDPD